MRGEPEERLLEDRMGFEAVLAVDAVPLPHLRACGFDADCGHTKELETERTPIETMNARQNIDELLGDTRLHRWGIARRKRPDRGLASDSLHDEERAAEPFAVELEPVHARHRDAAVVQ